MNPLFRNASRAIKAAARAEFRSGELGRALTDLERKLTGRGKAKRYLRDIARKIHGREPNAGQIDRLAGKVERYAKERSESSILNMIGKAFGPLGDVIKSLLRPRGKRMASQDRETSAAINLLQAFGYEVIPPPARRAGLKAKEEATIKWLESLGRKVVPKDQPTAWVQPGPAGYPIKGRAAMPSPVRPLPGRKTIDVDLGMGRRNRIKLDDPLLTGAMIPVTSSNVHSIGFEINPHAPQIGTLKVRFLQDHGDAKVAGPLYDYFNVPTEVFQRFRKAASKGKFVWDKLRIRGTVSGHRFDYRLAGISRGYVPRKATLAPEGEYFMKRTFLGENTRTGEKRLFASRESALVRPSANRGSQPNRGQPNRGRG